MYLYSISTPLYGGFGQAPKFPNSSNLLFLLRCHHMSGINRYKDFVMFTAIEWLPVEFTTR